jgi:glycosyltransferase involved in cell wall biosynthesis
MTIGNAMPLGNRRRADAVSCRPDRPCFSVETDRLSSIRVLILSETAPLNPEKPATGLAVRHTRMAEALAASGAKVTFAHREPVASSASASYAFEVIPAPDPDVLARWIRRQSPDVAVLGYWEFHDWIPCSFEGALVLDYVAPRMLERQFEDRDRLAEDASRLVPLLERCREVWVGHERQVDLMLPWMLLAGHDCRFRAPIRVVPISAPVADAPAARHPEDPPLAFHGGQDWPWRQSERWLDRLQQEDHGWRLADLSGPERLRGFADYLDRLSECDLLLELCDENTERRYSQSFRMTDALSRGVPVVANRFLPIAAAIERQGAGWLIDEPEELGPLLAELAKRPDALRKAAEGALALAREQFDAERHYAGLAAHLQQLAAQPLAERPKALDLGPREAEGWSGSAVVRDYARRWVHHRLRLPVHRWLRRRGAKRPQPSDDAGRCWVVVSRPDLFPTDHGAAVKIERTAWALSFHVDRVVLLSDRRDRYWVYDRGERSEHRFPLWPRIAGWPRAVNLIRLMARGLPYSNAFLYLPLVDRGLHARLLWLLNRFPVEVVQAEFPAYAHAAVWSQRLFGTGSLLVEHNVEFQRIADQVPELGARGARLLKQTEVELSNACDHVITVSDRDREDLIAAGVHETRIVTIPHGVDLERFARAEPIDLRAKYGLPAEHAVLVYHGIYSYPPNLEAVEELSSHLLPALEARGVGASVVAFGPEPPDRDLPGVTFAGAVEDLAAHLMGADLAVIPLRAGGGTRMKILDDFAARVPVVTTRKGMEGLPVTDGEQLRIVDEPESMAEVVRALLDDPAERKRLAEGAAEWVAGLDWRAIAARYVARVRGEA